MSGISKPIFISGFPGWARDEVVPSDLFTFSDGVTTMPGIIVNGENRDPENIREYVSIPGAGKIKFGWPGEDEQARSADQSSENSRSSFR